MKIISDTLILWIDDEIDLLKPYILFLNSRGYKVKTATNGVDALDMLDNESIDLVLLDENMPGLSGLETLERISRKNPNLPVVMITKSEEEDLMNQAIGKYIADYLIKPVHPKQILLSLKKILGGKSLIEVQNTTDYREDFAKISGMVDSATNLNDWFEIYRRLVYWESRLQDSPMAEIILLQKKDANRNFSRFIMNNYKTWFERDHPLLSPYIFKEKVFPLLDRGEKVFFIIIDNFRYDQWKVIQPMLTDLFEFSEEMSCSIIPTTTQYSRNSIFAGLMPLEISRMYPNLWVNEGDDAGLNRYEKDLLELQLNRFGRKESFLFHKINDSRSGEQFLSQVDKIKTIPLNVLVMNFVDMMSHIRSESKALKELSNSDSAYLSLTGSWFRHSSTLDIFRKISSIGSKVILTTDHGSIRVDNPVKVIGDKEINSNPRYKVGKNLKYNSKEVYACPKPEEIGIPSSFASSFIFAYEDNFFVYPNNMNEYVKLYSDTIQHGGISMEEMLLPFVVMTPKA